MQSKFPSYYLLTSSEKKALFNDTSCYFVFDTNALLDLYRLGKDKMDKVLELIDKYIDRIVIPYHVAEEYHCEMLNVITNQISSCSNVIRDRKDDTIIRSLCEQLDLNKYPTLKDKFVSSLRSTLDSLYNGIESERNYLLEQLESWDLQKRIADCLGSKLLEGFNKEELKEIVTEGEMRYEEDIPPGYKDKGKTVNRYGDFIIWKEMLRFAEKEKCSIIFISRDLKEDWVSENNGMKCGPRYELLEEFKMKSGGSFVIYTLDKFLEYANEEKQILESVDLEEVIKVLKSLSSWGKLLKEKSKTISVEDYPNEKSQFTVESKEDGLKLKLKIPKEIQNDKESGQLKADSM